MNFAWISDTHIGYRQYGLDRRLKDFEHAFESAVLDILSKGIRVILHSGDLLNSNRPGPDTIHCLNRVHGYLIAHQAHMVVASGNHDYSIPPWPSVLVGDKYGIKCRDREVVRFDGLNVYCLPFMGRDEFLSHRFQEADVLLWHGLVRPFFTFNNPNVLDIGELPCERYRMVLLGDVHVCEMRQAPQNPGCKVGYIGSTELCHSTESEDKFWGEINTDNWSIERHPIDTRPVCRFKVDEELTDAKMELFSTIANAAASKSRHPIIFVDYDSNVPKVIERIRAMFNPDQFILQPRPVLRLAPGVGIPMPGDGEGMPIEEILRSQIATRQDLMPVALGLINQEMDPGTVLDEWITSRLQQPVGGTETANV